MSYDRVEYSDRAHFSSPSDEHHYSDDPVRNGSKHTNGNGIYNDYTVELKPKIYSKSYKFLCCECKNTKSVKFIMAGACMVFCLAMVLIVISAVAHHKEKSSKSKAAPKHGLLAYGPDDSGLISFSAVDHKTYMNYFNRMESGLADYNTLKQASNLDKYIPCDDNTTKVPEGKVCMLTLEKFGENCQHFDMYGITEERPCVLLVLKPEKDLIPKPFDFTDDKNADIKGKLGNRTCDKNIAISCEGKTEQDQALLMKMNDSNRIDYNPPMGFPMYYFPQSDTDGYLYPAVMVQFNTVPNQQTVTVKCTAWAQNFNNGEPQKSKEYSTEFTALSKVYWLTDIMQENKGENMNIESHILFTLNDEEVTQSV